jgi:hypothetical protein
MTAGVYIPTFCMLILAMLSDCGYFQESTYGSCMVIKWGVSIGCPDLNPSLPLVINLWAALRVAWTLVYFTLVETTLYCDSNSVLTEIQPSLTFWYYFVPQYKALNEMIIFMHGSSTSTHSTYFLWYHSRPKSDFEINNYTGVFDWAFHYWANCICKNKNIDVGSDFQYMYMIMARS